MVKRLFQVVSAVNIRFLFLEDYFLQLNMHRKIFTTFQCEHVYFFI